MGVTFSELIIEPVPMIALPMVAGSSSCARVYPATNLAGIILFSIA